MQILNGGERYEEVDRVAACRSQDPLEAQDLVQKRSASL